MIWGRPGVEKLFGGPRSCDLCHRPAIAFHAGRSRCDDHLTQEMLEHRWTDSQPFYPGRPRLTEH
jgi:hypothetical protein